MLIMPWVICVFGVLAAVLAGCARTEIGPAERPVPTATATPAAQPLPPGKHVRVTLQVTRQAVTVEAVEAGDGPARSYVAEPDQFRVILRTAAGDELGVIHTRDPLIVRVYSTETPERRGRQQFTEEAVELEAATMVIFLPFSPKLAAAEFTDASGQTLGRADLRPPIRTFCTARPNDDDCQEWTRLNP